MKAIFYTCVLLCLALVISARSEPRGNVDREPGSTIIIFPTLTALTFEDSSTVQFERDRFTNAVRDRAGIPTRSMAGTEERAFWLQHESSIGHDSNYRNAMHEFDRAISSHRGRRGASRKADQRPRIASILRTLGSNSIELESVDWLSGAVILSGSVYDVADIRSLFPGETVELLPPITLGGVFANAETRVKWLHDRGINGSAAADDTLAFDYMNLDTGVDTTVVDIVGGHRLFGNTDPANYDPFPSGSQVAKSDHGTATCGIVTSDNSLARGTAYALDAIFVSNVFEPWGISSYGPPIRGLSWGCADTDSLYGDSPDVIHCAWGATGYGYGGFPKFMDSIVDEFDVFLASIAGNHNWGVRYSLWDCGTAYNAVVSNALVMHGDTLRVNDTLGDGEGGATVGGWGPTLNGRKKPDLCAPVASMYVQTYGDSIFQHNVPSTSLSAPQVAGAGILLMGRGVTNQRSMKALMLNTTFRPSAMSATGWEPGFGWGMLDADHAVIHADQGDYFEATAKALGVAGDKVYFEGTFLPFDAENNTFDRATLAWERHVNWSYGDTNITANDLTNLDLYLYDASDFQLVSSSTSGIDNVEQVYWDSLSDTLTSGILVVDCQSGLPPGWSYEPFSLATEEGFIRFSSPKQVVGLNAELVSALGGEIDEPYDLVFRAFTIGDALCDTFWFDLTGLDANTSVVSGPSPAYAIMSPGDTVLVDFTLVSSTTGKRKATFGSESTCYRNTWYDGADASYQVVDYLPETGSREDGDGILRDTIFEITGISQSSGGATVYFGAPQATNVTAEVFDVRGSRIYKTSINAQSGNGSVFWPYSDSSGARCASGVYFVRVRGGGSESTKRLVLLK